MRQDAVRERLDESNAARPVDGSARGWPAEAEAMLFALSEGEGISLASARERAGGARELDALRQDWDALGLPIRERAAQLVWVADILGLSADRIAGHLSALDVSCAVRVEALTDSTNAQLLADAAAGAVAAPSALLCECQRAGRGRRQRVWQGRFGESILMSVLLHCARPLAELPGVAIVAGLAVHRALSELGAGGLAVKWPNDLLLHDAKLAGILVESTGRAGQLVVGIGMNWSGAADLSARLGRPVAALKPALPDGVDRNRVAAALLAALVKDVQRFADDGLRPFLPAFARHDALAGRTVRVMTADAMSRYGTACGLAPDGGLKVDHGGTRAVYHSADVSVVLA
ncbi:biotin--[acetyl-CoA-carboxylase] ligase [Pseudofulvimonas gallinarii]|uniref:BirA family biotin operon repressor/biotin-[acetyl-CoA-carboxylase] ligase n=1 Tax=Pseudofulvimonas gallinarii TaxID=634155 RepID=A0A4V2UWM7_9GAMM|nr:BirA family biotin operon repressor/biotin-[acetyl-CoA-carboxylase] ligase [Pseudofulvimonas gallinarii]